MTAAGSEFGLEQQFLEIVMSAVPKEIPHLHFTEALAMISAATGKDVSQEPDLAPSHERWPDKWGRREHESDWLYVTGYPMAKRPFYIHPDPARPTWSNSFDLLFRGLEIVTGGQRLHRHDDYLAALERRGIDPTGFTGYLQAFQTGMPPHGGFALGMERFVARIANIAIANIANVRETILFPRDLHRLTP
jgi:nondiscriminating aspartyl-tRNA synthetase